MAVPQNRASVGRMARHAAAVAIFMAAASQHPAHADGAPTGAVEAIAIDLDRSKLIKLPERATTIVIGNPLIADASLQAGGLMVLTGKGYGATNLIALDRKGNALMEKTLLVRGPQDTVVVYKGVNRETYSCAPQCEPRITPGDAQQFFTQTLSQTATRSSQATAMSNPQR